MKFRSLLSVVFLAVVINSAFGDPILLDRSPDAFPAATLEPSSWIGSLGNNYNGQRFADDFVLNIAATITGMGLYSGDDFASYSLGVPVIISLYANDAGQPGTLLSETAAVISAINSDGVSTAPGVSQEFVSLSTALAIEANTRYWIGMTSNNPDTSIGMLTLAGGSAPDDASVAIFYRDSFILNLPIGDQSFRLYGTASGPHSVSETGASVILVSMGLSFLALIKRRQSQPGRT